MNDSNDLDAYFLPKALDHRSSMVHSSCYRLSLSILRRATNDPVCIPIDSLNMEAIITENKIWFAENQPTMKRHDETGKKILICWEFYVAEARNSNDQHIPMKIIFYQPGLEELQNKLTGDFYKALMLVDQQHSETPIPAEDIRFIDLENSNDAH